MKEDKFTLMCERCQHTWTQEVLFGDIDWTCPKCKLSDEVATIKYEPNNKNRTDLILGQGTGNPHTAWKR